MNTRYEKLKMREKKISQKFLLFFIIFIFLYCYLLTLNIRFYKINKNQSKKFLKKLF